ncbi:uncharacterized protein B0H18DRAFT_113896 [Fomitopsis serialis]|uniref:uncharacterized protein n=1 Tax=Fomitopsis serialis TaxID=139415 RepID=UPI0020073EC7|nr:uncharacterized protein B0H18DRAFT_113896 [Neoantrodia serialis]KAH9914924.1 hypothetical protein B0H18DRAFT_113896 [Neoantrodia serialis]
MSKHNKCYGCALDSLRIEDHPDKPFAHTFPVRVPGRLLSQLESLKFSQLDWTSTRPHLSFFTHLSYFSSVTCLSLRRCRLRRADEIWMITRALPGLEVLRLRSIAVESAALDSTSPPRSPIAVNQKLREIQLRDYAGCECPLGMCDGQHLSPSLLDVLPFYSTVDTISLRCTGFLSASDFQSFVYAFPALRNMHIDGDLLPEDLEPPTTPADTVALATGVNAGNSWAFVRLSQVSSAFAFVFFELFAQQCCKLEELRIDLLEPPSSTMSQTISQILRVSGPALGQFEWNHPGWIGAFLPHHVPHRLPPSLTDNTSLGVLTMDFISTSALNMIWAYGSLLSLFAQIGSTHLQSVHVYFLTFHGIDDSACAITVEAIAAFHAALSRNVFARLSYAAVTISFRVSIGSNQEHASNSVAETLHTSSATVKSFLIHLFSPWLARGVMTLELPDGSRIQDPGEPTE